MNNLAMKCPECNGVAGEDMFYVKNIGYVCLKCWQGFLESGLTFFRPL